MRITSDTFKYEFDFLRRHYPDQVQSSGNKYSRSQPDKTSTPVNKIIINVFVKMSIKK